MGEDAPESTVETERMIKFVDEIDALLRKEHEEEYCGIVYVDDKKDPSFIKIFDPHNLGVSCGFSDNPPLPGWIMSLTPPIDLPNALAPTASRGRWWRRLFAG